MSLSWSRWSGVAPTMAVVVVRLAAPEATGAAALLLVTATFIGACWLFGRGLLRLVSIPIPDGLHTSVSIVLGAVLWILLTNILLLCRAAAITQTLLLALAFVAATVLVIRPGHEAPRVRLRDLLPVVAALVAAILPLVTHDAFSVAGNDFDTLTHPDGGQHTVLVMRSLEGIPRAAAYSLGTHSMLGGMANLCGLDAFRTVAAGVPLLLVFVVCATHWLAAVVGLGDRARLAVAIIAGVHPLVLFVAMEQYLPHLTACALVTSAFAATVASDGSRRSLVVVAMVLAALLACYGLAFAIVLPIFAIVGLRQARLTPKAMIQVLVLAFAIAPLGALRLVERGQVIQSYPERTFGVDKKTEERPILFPGGYGDDVQLSARMINWSATLAHVVGLTPFRDHYYTIAQLDESLEDAVEWWSGLGVPALTIGVLATSIWGLWRARPTALDIGVLALLAVTYTLSAFKIVHSYHLFKIASIATPTVLVMIGRSFGALPRSRWWSPALALVLVSLLAATATVQLRYNRALALDRDFVAMVEPVTRATRGKSVTLFAPSQAIRVWMQTYVLGRARITRNASLVLCTTEWCPRGTVLIEHGWYRLIDRQNGLDGRRVAP